MNEWQQEFGNIERVEKLTLPTWEEIENRGEFFRFIKLYHFDNISLFFNVYKFTKTIEVSWSDGVLTTSKKINKHYDFTQEDYIEACRLVKKLFIGEQNG